MQIVGNRAQGVDVLFDEPQLDEKVQTDRFPLVWNATLLAKQHLDQVATD